jgi:hypothetical protein
MRICLYVIAIKIKRQNMSVFNLNAKTLYLKNITARNVSKMTISMIIKLKKLYL